MPSKAILGTRNSSMRCLAILLGLVCLLWIPRCSGTIDLRYDGGVYYVLGTSLAQGKGYRLLNEPGEIEAIQYPPLLPAIVAAHQVVLGTSDPARDAQRTTSAVTMEIVARGDPHGSHLKRATRAMRRFRRREPARALKPQ